MDQNIKIFSRKFLRGILIYLGAFLAVLAVGLGVFWKFIEAYEISRPINTINAYLEQLTPQTMAAQSDELYASVDANIQTREQFNQVICNSLTEKISYAKKSSESSQTRQVYVLRSGKTPIGKFSIEAGEEGSFGFRNWEVTETSFDFSHLVQEPVSITVPSGYPVYANGCLLDESYITQSGIQYTALEGFYDEYQLPVMVTYTVDNFLGDLTLEATDETGAPVEITPETDMNMFLPVCSEWEQESIVDFAHTFVRLWVNFSSSQKDNVHHNYYQLHRILSEDGVLIWRLYSAIEGLTFGQTTSASIQDVVIHRIVPLGDGLYMCDLTYQVRTIGQKGPVETVNNMKIIISTENGSYKLKSMERY